jgi:hypothetical protein
MEGVLNGLPPTNKGWNEKMKRCRKSSKNRFTNVVTGRKACIFAIRGRNRSMEPSVSKGFEPSRSPITASKIGRTFSMKASNLDASDSLKRAICSFMRSASAT